MVQKVPPVVAKPGTEKAIFSLNWLSATGSGILLAASIAGLFMRYSLGELLRKYLADDQAGADIRCSRSRRCWRSVSRHAIREPMRPWVWHSRTPAALYPFFGTMLGWLGVALTGSDTASNVLFGGLQKITSEQLGLNPNLMAAANSSGGVMGKMIDAQSIVVASHCHALVRT